MARVQIVLMIAAIAKIPFPLARYIGEFYYPR